MNDQQLDRIWIGMLDSERLSRYYTTISIRSNRFDFAAKIVSISLSVIISGGLLTNLLGPYWVTALSIIFVIATIWAAFSNFSHKAFDAAIVAADCKELALKWRNLWTTCELLGDEVSMEKIEKLEKEMLDRTSFRKVIYIGLNEKINAKCAEETYEVIKQEFNLSPSYVG